ncbi:MAG: hypothetical protein ACJAT1_001827 [Marivirga sp.]|jgi:hypothetical protein
MKKKLIFAMSTALLAAGLSFGLSGNSEASAYPCKNGIAKGNNFLGACVGSGPDCFRCKIFAQVAE